MKKLAWLISVFLLAGCAASDSGMGLTFLETEPYMRASRTLPLSFVQIQRAIFKHQATCASDLKFAVDPDHPSYARVGKDLSKDADWNHVVVLGLTLVHGHPTRAKVYSYYTITDKQIDQLYDAILHPEVCP